MAIHTTTFQCGHTGTTNVSGSPEKQIRELAKVQERVSQTLCDKCELKALRADGKTAEADAIAVRAQRGGRQRGMRALAVTMGEDAMREYIRK